MTSLLFLKNIWLNLHQRKTVCFPPLYQWPLAACLAAIIKGVRLAKGLESLKNGCCKKIEHLINI